MNHSQVCTNFLELYQTAYKKAKQRQFGFYADLPHEICTVVEKQVSQDGFEFISMGEHEGFKVFYLSWENAFLHDDMVTGMFKQEHYQYLVSKIMGKPCEFPSFENRAQELFLIALGSR